MPKKIRPMLATLVDKPFNDADWIFEVKWDGYRAIALMNHDKISLQSRNDKSFEEKFYPVHTALKSLNRQAVIDGEIVVLDENGISSFGALQNWRSEADGQLIYYIFDILWLNGKDLRKLPLARRREILIKQIRTSDIIRISEGFDEKGIDLFNSVRELGLEGIIAKKKDSPYQEDARSRDWLKIKTQKRPCDTCSSAPPRLSGGFAQSLRNERYIDCLIGGAL